MPDEQEDKSVEVRADIISHAINGRRLRALDGLFPNTDLAELRKLAKELDNEFNWFHYRGSDPKVTVSDVDAARDEIQDLRNSVYDA